MIRRILRIISRLILIFCILVPVFLILPRFAGYGMYTIISDSMSPALPIGSLIYVRDIDPEKFQKDDIACFYLNETSRVPISHRVVENDTAKQEIVTKGDRNEKEDFTSVPYVQIIGKVFFHLPVLGYVVLVLEQLWGKILFGALFIASLLAIELKL